LTKLNLDRSINKLLERINNLYPDVNNNGPGYWKGRKIVPLDQWYQVKERYSLKVALQYFPNDFDGGFPSIIDKIEDQALKEDAIRWYSDFVKLMEYSRNTKYGRTLCFRCLLSPDREMAKIFAGMNKVISRTLDTDSESVYPCKILNRFLCPYDKKIMAEVEDIAMDNNQIEKPNVDYLFYLSELAFAVELALAKARGEDSVFKIKSAADVHEALTNKETLEMVLQQGLKEEHMRYKDEIVKLLMGMKDRIKTNDLT
jgi:hypothetical protein